MKPLVLVLNQRALRHLLAPGSKPDDLLNHHLLRSAQAQTQVAGSIPLWPQQVARDFCCVHQSKCCPLPPSANTDWAHVT